MYNFKRKLIINFCGPPTNSTIHAAVKVNGLTISALV